MKVMEIIIIIEIVMEKLGITDEEVKERVKRYHDQSFSEEGSVQPQEAGTDADHSGGQES